jgi:hypothetical protein
MVALWPRRSSFKDMEFSLLMAVKLKSNFKIKRASNLVKKQMKKKFKIHGPRSIYGLVKPEYLYLLRQERKADEQVGARCEHEVEPDRFRCDLGHGRVCSQQRHSRFQGGVS